MSQDTKPIPMTTGGKRNRWNDPSTNSTMLKALAYRVDWLLEHHIGRDNFLQVFDEAEAKAEAEAVGPLG